MSYCTRKNSANRTQMIRSPYDEKYNKTFDPNQSSPLVKEVKEDYTSINPNAMFHCVGKPKSSNRCPYQTFNQTGYDGQ